MRIILRMVTLVFASLLIVPLFAHAENSSQSDAFTVDELKTDYWLHEWLTVPAVEVPAVEPSVVAPAQANCDYYTTYYDWWVVASQAVVGSTSDIFYRNWCGSSQNITNHPASDIEPSMNVDGSQIVFASNRDGNYELYIVNPDGGGLRRLTSNPLNDYSPDWSKLNRIVYTVDSPDVDSEIWVINADGSGQQQLTNNGEDDVEPAWSPAGDKIYWVRVNANGRDGDIWQMNADGSNPTKLTGPFRYLENLNLSPDGKFISFDADLSGDGANDVALMGVDGSSLTTLQTSSVSNYGSYLIVNELWAGGWSPTSKQLSYSSLSYQVTRAGVTLQSASIASSCLDTITYDCPYVSSDIEMNYNPKLANRDPYPPVTHMQPLPEFSRNVDMLLSWQRFDMGPSGVNFVYLQKKSDSDPEWRDFIDNSYNTSASWSRMLANLGDSGKVYFRMRAADNAQNEGSFPPNGNADISTRLYAGLLNGSITDNRAVAQPNKKLQLQPAAIGNLQSDVNGKFLALLDNLGSYVLNENTFVSIQRDTTRNIYQHPSDSIIGNGDFEFSDLRSWSFNNVYTQSKVVGTGDYALKLAAIDCVSACLEVPANINQGLDASPQTLDQSSAQPDLWIQAMTSIPNHVYALGRKSEANTLYFSERDENRSWSKPLPISNDPSIVGFNILAASSTEIYALIVRNDGSIKYLKRTGALWSSAIDISIGTLMTFSASPKGGFHIVYEVICGASKCAVGATRKVVHRFIASNGSISGETNLIDDANLGNVDRAGMLSPKIVMSTDNNDKLQVAYSEYVSTGWTPGEVVSRIFYRTRAASGSWSVIDLVPNTFGSPAYLQADEQGDARLIVSASYLYLLTRKEGRWSQSRMLDAANRTWLFASDRNSSFIYALGVDTNVQPPSENTILHRISVDGSPLDARQLSLNANYAFSPLFVATGQNNLTYVSPYFDGVNNSLSVSTSRLVSAATDSSVSQSIFVIDTLHKPTLSFLYSAESSSTGGSFFEVTVSHEITPSTIPTETLSSAIVSQTITATQLFSTTSNTPWQLGWVDMTSWQGQTITVTFAVHQMAGDTPMQVYLDEVSLGSWKTPLPMAVSPTKIEYGIGATLLITGENFLGQLQVKLGNTVLQNIKRIDETQLEATVPASIAAGAYPIEVINPEGQNSMSPVFVYIGKQIFLPIIAR